MRTVILVAALLLAFASGAIADKSLTYFTAVASDVNSVQFERSATAPNGWVITARALVRASVGSGYWTSVAANATPGQKTTIENFITNNVVPALNTQEGL